MRVVFDTNILVSALLSANGPPSRLLDAWHYRRFTLLTFRAQIEEFRSTVRKPSILEQVRPAQIGRLFNELKTRAIHVDSLPFVLRSSDPEDDFLLALGQAGNADYIVSGDKPGVLALRKHANTGILTAREFLDQIS